MLVRNMRSGLILGTNIEQARTFWARLRGLIGRRYLPVGHGLLLEPCSSVHTLGMAFAIEAIYLDRDNRVLRIAQLPPGRFGPLHFKARRVLEVPTGTCVATQTTVGDQLQLSCTQPSRLNTM